MVIYTPKAIASEVLQGRVLTSRGRLSKVTGIPPLRDAIFPGPEFVGAKKTQVINNSGQYDCGLAVTSSRSVLLREVLMGHRRKTQLTRVLSQMMLSIPLAKIRGASLHEAILKKTICMQAY
jgi:hypothetical protein